VHANLYLKIVIVNTDCSKVVISGESHKSTEYWKMAMWRLR